MSLKSLFCKHEWKVLSEHTETYDVRVQETTYGGAKVGATTFWGEPIMTKRTDKTVLCTCTRGCGTIKKFVL